MSDHPATGPISPEQMRALADAPYGKAIEGLREHDPLWGMTKGEVDLKSFKVTLRKDVPMKAIVTVQAADEDHARYVVWSMKEGDIVWSDNAPDDFEIWDMEELA